VTEIDTEETPRALGGVSRLGVALEAWMSDPVTGGHDESATRVMR
jgi:hypothetical protein